MEIQNLGTIFIEDGHTHFKGNRLQSDHPDFYGLEEIRISDINSTGKPEQIVNSEDDYKFKKSILWIFLIVLPVLGLLFLAYTQQELLFGKKSFDNVSVKTKTHRIVKDTIKLNVHTPPVQDSIKKDSLVKPAETNVKISLFKNNTKTTWQK